jgi:F-box/WD-40 domain protein 7
VRHELKGHSDFIYSLACVGGLALSGSGNGILLAHNVASGEVLWGLGANEAAVRCIGVCAVGGGAKGRQVMLAAGDDGKCLLYDF